MEGAKDAQVILLTHHTQEKNMNNAIKSIEALESITADVVRIRVESLGS
ncbi:MAG: hypothetical protein GXP13_02290 [Gammaproteobacteria bacterium]|nr:hypothetical protein [Gammaproteobacteria bacterium]